MVTPIDHRDADRRPSETARDFEATGAGADDDDVM
jgi:hypothetical protein